MPINIDRAMAVSDYDCDERRRELKWLAGMASTRQRIVEVGSYKGCTTRALADNTTGHVYAVDTFAGSVGETQMAQEIASHEPMWLQNLFEKNTADLTNIHVMVMTSLEAASFMFLNKMMADMVFIDASHDYDSVKADLQAWIPVVYAGGILCGHDRQWDGVARAIDELVPGHRVGAGAIWWKEIS